MEHVDIVFDGPPSHESGRFVEVEDSTGKSIKFGEWVKRSDGFWALRLTMPFLWGWLHDAGMAREQQRQMAKPFEDRNFE